MALGAALPLGSEDHKVGPMTVDPSARCIHQISGSGRHAIRRVAVYGAAAGVAGFLSPIPHQFALHFGNGVDEDGVMVLGGNGTESSAASLYTGDLQWVGLQGLCCFHRTCVCLPP